MTILKYKGFQGSVDYADGVLLIQVLHIDDFITTECLDASEVKDHFRELIDDYLETCKLVGKSPCKSYSGTFNVRIDPELHRKFGMMATAKNVSLNSLIETTLRKEFRAEYITADVIKNIMQNRINISNIKLAELETHNIYNISRSGEYETKQSNYASIAKYQIGKRVH